ADRAHRTCGGDHLWEAIERRRRVHAQAAVEDRCSGQKEEDRDRAWGRLQGARPVVSAVARMPVRLRVAAAVAVAMALVLAGAGVLIYIRVGDDLSSALDQG